MLQDGNDESNTREDERSGGTGRRGRQGWQPLRSLPEASRNELRLKRRESYAGKLG